MADELRIIVLEGDETGQELLEQALRVLDPAVTKVDVALEHYDLSLENRRRTDNDVVTAAAAAHARGPLRHQGGDHHARGRRRCGQPQPSAAGGDRRQGDHPHGPSHPGRHAGGRRPLPDRRRAHGRGDAYGAKQWRTEEDGDEVAYRTERISRSVCRAVAEYSFRTAERIHGRVYGGPKWTVSPVYEGMLKEELDAAADRHPEVPYSPVLIDATYAGLVSGAADAPLVIPALNRDGDCLSDFVMPMFGSIAGAESVLLAFDDDYEPSAVMAEAPHGTAPALQGKDIANPMAMILAVAALLHYAATSATPTRPGLARDLRVGARGHGHRRPYARPRRPRDHERVHRRGHRPRAHQGRHLVLALAGRTASPAGAVPERQSGSPIALGSIRCRRRFAT